MRPLVLYHENCCDGFCAAWIAHRDFGNTADFQAVQYGQDPPDVSGRDLFILDFSYKRPVMLEMAKKAKRLTILDHHKTAEAELCGFSDEADNYLTFVNFDMKKSGARLTWEHFYPGAPSPWLVDWTEDRDLNGPVVPGRDPILPPRLPHTDEISAFLRSHPFDFGLWDDWHASSSPGSDRFKQFVAEGEAILRYQQTLIDQAVSHATEIDMDGHKVLAVNSTVLFSEIAGKLAEGRPFGMAWFQRSDGKRVHSLRSTKDGVDVSEVAKRHGGGGHIQSAGFTEGRT